MRSRYIGGTRNLDGDVTRVIGVNADSVADARVRIAERFTMLNRRFGSGGYTAIPVRPEQVAIIRIEAADYGSQTVGTL